MGMFYNYCKWNTRVFSHLYYKNIRISGTENIPLNGPVMLVANHPNSFLDAVLIGAAIDRPTHFLARGDAFNNQFAANILGSLNMLPVYRLSEGKENLLKNNETFDACQNILENNKMVLIFAEGISENNWELRPLKKGPARIAKKAWQSESDAKNLQIIPVGITYEHFTGEGKNIVINFGKPIHKTSFDYEKNEALFVKELNDRLSKIFYELAFIDFNMHKEKAAYSRFSVELNALTKQSNLNGETIISRLYKPESPAKEKKRISFIQASLFFLPFYKFCDWMAPKIVKESIFLDSIIFGLFILLWPIYLLLTGKLAHLILNFI